MTKRQPYVSKRWWPLLTCKMATNQEKKNKASQKCSSKSSNLIHLRTSGTTSSSYLLVSLYRDVRRAALLNIVPSKLTVDPILSRARDQDTTIRKLLYAHVLTSLPHPKSLSIAQREQAVRNGLKDREDSVRIAAGKLVGKWVDDLQGDLLQVMPSIYVEVLDLTRP